MRGVAPWRDRAQLGFSGHCASFVDAPQLAISTEAAEKSPVPGIPDGGLSAGGSPGAPARDLAGVVVSSRV